MIEKRRHEKLPRKPIRRNKKRMQHELLPNKPLTIRIKN
jgi:hypothetical protein